MTKHVTDDEQECSIDHYYVKKTAGVDLIINKRAAKTDVEDANESLGDASPIQSAA